MSERTMQTCETTQPWIIYTYGLTHDDWWPLSSSTKVLGYARIQMHCSVCGVREVAKIKMPRFGAVPEPPTGRHPMREAFLATHRHPDRGHPMSWAQPLANPSAHQGGVDLDLLAMRLEADMNKAAPEEGEPT